MEFTKSYIRSLASDDVSYARGVRYFKKGAVKNVRVSSDLMTYRADVEGEHTYQVSIGKAKEANPVYSCNCAEAVEKKGACRHIVALMSFLEHYQAQKSEEAILDARQKQTVKLLRYFKEQAAPLVYGETFSIFVNVRIPKLLSMKSGSVYLSIKAGNERMYKVQNLRKFLAQYEGKESIHLGKEFEFLPGESRFDHASQKVMKFLLELYEMEVLLGKEAGNGIFQKNEAVISLPLFLSFLSQTGESSFVLDINGNIYEDVTYKNSNPEMVFELLMENDVLTLECDRKYHTIPLSADGQLLLQENVLYHPEREFCVNYIPFYQGFLSSQEPMVFEGGNKNLFLEYVLPKIRQTMEIAIPAVIADRYVMEPLSIELYLDTAGTSILAELFFIYKNIRFNPLAGDIQKNVILVRSKQEENAFLEKLGEYHFRVKENRFVLSVEEEIYRFLTEGIAKLTECCTLYYSEDFQKVKVKHAGTLGTSVHFSSGISLLDLEISYENVPAEELRALFHSLKLRKKYHRLKDGSFIDLTQESFQEETSWLLSMGGQETKIRNQRISLPSWYAPYLAEVLPEKTTYLGSTGELQKLLEDISNPSGLKDALPETLKGRLRPYQETGCRWMNHLGYYGFGGILADDMGLGKTVQALSYMAMHEGCHLVVCPTSLLYNWQEEVFKFLPSIRCGLITGMPKEREELLSKASEYDLLITSYPLLRRDMGHYEKIEFHSMFIDEAQFIKNPKSLNARAVKSIKAAHRFAITGTPIENSLSELWSIFDFIMPGYLKKHGYFVEHYEKPVIRNQDREALEDLNRHIRPFILRRMKKEVLKELPDKVETKMYADMTQEQHLLYLSYLDHMKHEIGMQTSQEFSRNRMKILAMLTRLRQICCHPSTFVKEYEGGSGKLSMLEEITENIIESGHRVLIFSQFTSMLSLIAESFEEKDISYFYLDGATKTADRMEYVRSFNEGERNVFLISLKAGGTGLNLTGADTVIHYDPWWNPAVEEQASDRVYRIGQKNKVQIIRLITKDSIEEKILKLKEKKKALSESVIQADEVFLEKMTKEELLGILE